MAGGRSNVGVRAIARDVGLSPAGIYTYFDGVEAIVSAVVTDALASLAAAVEEATSAARAAQADDDGVLRAALVAYRDWAVSHPEEFCVVFTPSSPNDPAQPTVAAAIGSLWGEDGQAGPRARCWARLHGLVVLEVHGQLAGVAGDATTFYEAEVDDVVRARR